MKKLQYILTGIILIVTSHVFAQDVLENYKKTAAENNPELQAKFNDYYAALEKVSQVGALPDPMITFGYFVSPIVTKNGPQQAKVSFTQMFPWFGTLQSMENTAIAQAKAKYEMFEETRSKLFFDVTSVYYNLYFTQKAITITQDNIRILQSFLNLANIKIESGEASSVDSYRVQMEINELENQLAYLKDKLWTLHVQFNNLLNVDSQNDIIIVDTISHSEFLNKQALLDTILVNNNKLESYSYQIEALQEKEKVATKQGMPKVSLGIDYAIIGEGGKDAILFPMVGISIPLYRNKYNAMVQEAVYEQKAKEYEKQAQSNTLEVLFENSWRDYQDANRRVELYSTQLDLATKSIAILEAQYATSSSNFEEILRMERKVLMYSLELEKATADREVAQAFILYLQGK